MVEKKKCILWAFVILFKMDLLLGTVKTAHFTRARLVLLSWFTGYEFLWDPLTNKPFYSLAALKEKLKHGWQR